MNYVLETVGPRAGTSPLTYTLTEAGTVDLQAAFAHYDGSAASGSFRPALTIRAQNGTIIARVFPSSTLAAGDTADVTFATFLGDAADALTVQGEGVSLTQRSLLNFTGAGVTAADNAVTGATDVTISGSGSSGGAGPVLPGHRLGVTENRWYLPGIITTGGSSGGLSTANERTLYPFIPARNMTLDRIAVRCTATIGGSSVRVGMYADDGNIYPGALLFDAGTISTASGTGGNITISQALTSGTLYWAVIHYSHGSIQLTGGQVGDCIPILGWSDPVAATSAAVGWSEVVPFAVLPDPYPATASPFTNTVSHRPSTFLRGT